MACKITASSYSSVDPAWVRSNSIWKPSYVKPRAFFLLRCGNHPQIGSIKFRVKNSGKNSSRSRSVNPGKVTLKAKAFEIRQVNPLPGSQIGDSAQVGDSSKLKEFALLENWWRHLNFKFPSRKIRGIVLLNLLTIIYASSIPVVKVAQASVEPSLFTVLRFCTATVPFLPFIFRGWKDTEVRVAGLELGLWVGAGFVTQGIGLVTSDAGRAAFISALTVIIVPFLDGILGAKVSKITWLGASMATVGIALLESSGSPISIGDFWNLLSAIFFGIHMLRTEHFSRTTRKEKCIALLGYEVCVIAIISALWYLACICTSDCLSTSIVSINLEDFWRQLCALPWFSIIYTGVFSTAFCLWAELAAMRDVSATDAAIVYGLEPVWGAALAWFFLNERWGVLGWLGAILVIGGSFMVQLLESSKKVQ